MVVKLFFHLCHVKIESGLFWGDLKISLGDLVGITRQTSVFAFQLAEYINPVLPTSGVTMGILGLAGLKWEKWARWLVPLLVLWVLFAALTLIPPVLMKWGPA